MPDDPPARGEEEDKAENRWDLVKAHVDRGLLELENGKGLTLAYARGQREQVFWPIGLCIAWILSPDPNAAVALYARHRLAIGLVPIEGWSTAEGRLRHALESGELEAAGVRVDDGERVSIGRFDWIDLRIAQQGPYDQIRRADGKLAYRDARIEAAKISDRWPARKPESRATRSARQKRETEKACLGAIVQRMKEAPDDPVPKSALKQDFRNVSNRTFDRLYSQAARDSGCVAWSRGGRRRKQG